MDKADKEAEWANILDMGKTNPYFGQWLKERDERYRLGLYSDDHTRAIRKEFRKFLRGEIDSLGYPVRK